jgi:hypothetical protein
MPEVTQNVFWHVGNYTSDLHQLLHILLLRRRCPRRPARRCYPPSRTLNHTFTGQPHRNAIRTLEHIYAFHEFNMSCPRTCYWSGMKRRDSVVVAEIILVPTNFTYSLSNRARCFAKQTNLEHTLFCMSDLTIQILEHKLLQLLRCKKCRLQLGFRMHNLGIAGIHDSAVPTLASAREAG